MLSQNLTLAELAKMKVTVEQEFISSNVVISFVVIKCILYVPCFFITFMVNQWLLEAFRQIEMI